MERDILERRVTCNNDAHTAQREACQWIFHDLI
jgi:hypothetical protein